MAYLNETGLAHLWEKIKNKYVAKESNKGLSTNDYSNEDKAIVDETPTNWKNGTETGSLMVVGNSSLGEYAVAEGTETTALGIASHTEGAGKEFTVQISGEASATTFEINTDDSITTSQVNLGSIIRLGSKYVAVLYKSGSTIRLSEAISTSAISFNNPPVYVVTGATKDYAHAEGYCTTASGMHSHSEGGVTVAGGYDSHAEGEHSIAHGMCSHAQGLETTATGLCAHSEGWGTIAEGSYQHVQGKYNIPNSDYAHIVGNGSDTSQQSNAHTLDWLGNAWFLGEVYVGGTEQSDATKLLKSSDISAISSAKIDEICNTTV